MNEENFQYAIENTRVILAPERRIQSFGSTHFHFYLVTELMDAANQVRVREGRIEADRPQILSPGNYARLLLEGFGEKARGFADWLEQQSQELAFLKYGFQFRRTEVSENILHEPVKTVLQNVERTVAESEEPLSAIIQGVDDAWEVCLLKFTVDLIRQSAGDNIGDFRKRGLL